MNRFTDILPTRVSLLEQAQSSMDHPAWDELLKYYEPFVNKVLLRMGLRGADLEDAKQQVSLKLWQGLKNYRRDEKRARFRNWLSTLIRNAAIDWIKKQRYRQAQVPMSGPEVEAMNPEDPGIEEVIEREWQKHVVAAAMENLKEVFSGKAFKVFALSLKGESNEVIAEKLDLRKESVYVLKARVKKRLHQEIKRLRYELEGYNDE